MQPANFLCFVSFVRAKEMKSPAARAKIKPDYTQISIKSKNIMRVLIFTLAS